MTNIRYVHREAFKINLADLLPLPFKISKKKCRIWGCPPPPLCRKSATLTQEKFYPEQQKRCYQICLHRGAKTFASCIGDQFFLGLIGQLVCVTSELLQLGQKCGQLQTVFHQQARMSDKGMRSVNVVS